MTIDYQLEPDLTLEEFASVLLRSTLAARRPMSDTAVMEGMLRHADLLLTARTAGQLIGVARALTDFSYCTYLADLAVDTAWQGRGVGRELIAQAHAAAGVQTLLILLAAPEAETYYPHIGLQQHHSCWTIPRQVPVI